MTEPHAVNPTEPHAPDITRRLRVISDNDYAGDPDGLVQLAHLLLSPSVDVRCVIGSAQDANGPRSCEALVTDAVAKATEVRELCHRHDVPIVRGCDGRLVDVHTPIPSPAVDAIIAEALRDDVDTPLYITVGGGLTALASALLIEPQVAERVTLVWIGGSEHAGIATPPPGTSSLEYNTEIDLCAAQVVFNHSRIPIWQVPRDAYRLVTVSRAELLHRLRPHGPLGEYLWNANEEFRSLLERYGLHMGETWVFGDSPLVLLTALQTNFHPAPASSHWVEVPRVSIRDDGSYGAPDAASSGTPLRVFDRLDTRLLLDDLYAKLELHAVGSALGHTGE